MPARGDEKATDSEEDVDREVVDVDARERRRVSPPGEWPRVSDEYREGSDQPYRIEIVVPNVSEPSEPAL
jgi:hypothetical protein